MCMVPCLGNRQPRSGLPAPSYRRTYACMGHTGDVDISGFDSQYAIKHTFGGLLVAADSSRKVCVTEATTCMLPRQALQLRNASNAVLLIRKMRIEIIIHVPPCVCGARPALTRHSDTHLTLRQTCVQNPICMVTSLSLGLANPATLAYTRNQVTGITPCSLAPYRFRKRLVPKHAGFRSISSTGKQ
jgi:hypothetical protein